MLFLSIQRMCQLCWFLPCGYFTLQLSKFPSAASATQPWLSGTWLNHSYLGSWAPGSLLPTGHEQRPASALCCCRFKMSPQGQGLGISYKAEDQDPAEFLQCEAASSHMGEAVQIPCFSAADPHFPKTTDSTPPPQTTQCCRNVELVTTLPHKTLSSDKATP